MMNWSDQFATRTQRIVTSDVRELAKLMGQPDIISFGGGIPDPELFPHEIIAAASQRILGDPKSARLALQYSASGGYPPLKEWLVGYMAAQGVTCGPENILIVTGSQQGLDLIGRLFLSPGDKVLVEMPTYIGALRAFDACEAEYGRLPCAANNYDIGGIVEGGIASAQRPKFGYVMADFQNPMGTTLSLEERHALLDCMDELDLPLVEDNAYDRLRYDGEKLPSLLALDAGRAGSVENGRVILTATFSKMIVPSLRVGWVVAPEPVIHKLMLLKQASDLHTSTFNQMLILEVSDQVLKEYLPVIQDTYRRRRDAVLSALATHMPPGVTWTRPQGGMYVWVTLPEGIDGTEFAQTALREAKVAVVSGKSCYPSQPVPNTIRLAFPQTREDRAEEGVKRLAALLARMTAACA
jgi:DNA-binding transcriptional MocR family regulator